MKTITLRIYENHRRAFEFYAKHFEVRAAMLMQSLIYDEACDSGRDIFGVLESWEGVEAMGEPEEITLEFCPEVFALFTRAVTLLRWPLADFLNECLRSAGRLITSVVSDALENDNIYDTDHADWANQAIRFERAARQNIAPGISADSDGWRTFNLRVPMASILNHA